VKYPASHVSDSWPNRAIAAQFAQGIVDRVRGWKQLAELGIEHDDVGPFSVLAAVTPRVALEKSYSGRSVSRSGSGLLLLLAFFVVMAFASCRFACADDSGSLPPLGVSDN
jgi:hypothetical protein